MQVDTRVIKSRRNKSVPRKLDYNATDDDSRPIVDPELEYQADRIGLIHSRKHKSPTVFLEGYGRTNFGVSAYKIKRIYLTDRNFIIAGLSAAGVLAWKLRSNISSSVSTAYTWALLFREAARS
jgi:hypothetical protein